MIDLFNGMQVIVNEFMDKQSWEQIKFPRSKKKRIRKKWTRNRKNWGMRLVAGDSFVIGRTIYMGCIAYSKIRNHIGGNSPIAGVSATKVWEDEV